MRPKSLRYILVGLITLAPFGAEAAARLKNACRMILLMGLLWPLAVQGNMAPDRRELPNLDKRTEAVAGAGQQAADPSKAVRQQAGQQLKARLPAVQIDEDELLGTPKFVRASDGFLTGPGGEGRGVKAETIRALAPNDPHPRETSSTEAEMRRRLLMISPRNRDGKRK